MTATSSGKRPIAVLAAAGIFLVAVAGIAVYLSLGGLSVGGMTDQADEPLSLADAFGVAEDGADQGSGAGDAASVGDTTGEEAAGVEQAALATMPPTDLQGWRQRGLAHQAKGEFRAARDAWKQAAALAPDDPDVLLSYAESLVGLSGEGEKIAPELAAVSARILALDPDNWAALYYAGLAARDDGDIAAARIHWQRLLTILPTGGPEQNQIQGYLDELGDGG